MKRILNKEINFCPICFKDDESISFKEYGKNRINEKKEKQSIKEICDYLKKVKTDFFEKVKNYEIDNIYEFLKEPESNKCFHFYHEKCKKEKHIKDCPLCNNGCTVRNHFMILNELNDKYDWHCEFDFELEYIHGLDTYRRKLEKKNLKRYLLRKIEKNKEIPEEVKNKYMKRYEMEKFYLRKGNTMERI